MNISKSIILLFISLACSTMGIAQPASYDSSFHFYYYDQKLSMFEKMTDHKNEVVWLGDSITDGGEWSELFPGIKTLNRGISSDNTFGVLFRLREVTKRKPKKVFILIGINDIARNIPVEVILRNYRKIVSEIQRESSSTKIYIQSLLPTNSDFKNFSNHQNKTDKVLAVNAGLQNIAHETGSTFIDLYKPFLNENGKLDEQYTNDGLHLMGAGYLHWKEVIISNGGMK